ncbi:uncharacterized protein HD556DRAFT_1305409 [Suillus plorans]|uniref:Uncharacterized protein n=1 Tax=Suillus plorans TaxID=116603 RepID=A0A9P7DPL3_9AGAM|nr:uncharacterized protein HD556DRAFT_1305409 [Suillus plorans]KAG1799898.1 hypothetical protein HD556DRAFT_1305409 [Suillus plorans]
MSVNQFQGRHHVDSLVRLTVKQVCLTTGIIAKATGFPSGCCRELHGYTPGCAQSDPYPYPKIYPYPQWFPSGYQQPCEGKPVGQPPVLSKYVQHTCQEGRDKSRGRDTATSQRIEPEERTSSFILPYMTVPVNTQKPGTWVWVGYGYHNIRPVPVPHTYPYPAPAWVYPYLCSSLAAGLGAVVVLLPADDPLASHVARFSSFGEAILGGVA